MDESNHLKPTDIPADAWVGLKQFTTARIALGRVGSAIPLAEVLAFKLAHAHARDAVHSELDQEKLSTVLSSLSIPFVSVKSHAANRQTYLKRPDLGRRLDAKSSEMLESSSTGPGQFFDISIIIADGLSATAVNEHAILLLKSLLPMLGKDGFTFAPIVLAAQARVAVADEIGSLQKAKLSLILIGERPGLGSADSMGAYITFAPKPGLRDDSRNCISNIRPAGLPIELAAEKIRYFIRSSFQLQLSGIALKDESDLLLG